MFVSGYCVRRLVSRCGLFFGRAHQVSASLQRSVRLMATETSDDYVPKGEFIKLVPDGDDRERDVCTSCGFVNYVNPKVIVGCVVAHEDKVLLVKRNNAPRLGYWTLPAGFMETNETVEAGAEREVWEEAGAKVKAGDLLAYMSVPHISQVHLYHSATFVDESSPDITPGPEAMDVRMFTQDEIPWEDLAFPSVEHALQLHFGKAPPPTYSTTLAPPTWLAKK